MNLIPIPKIKRGLKPEERALALEGTVDAIYRNFMELMKPRVGARNLALESIETRHLNDEIFGTGDDLANLRFGDAELEGALERLSRADHKHALDPILILRRSDPATLAASTNNWAVDTGFSLFFVDASLAVNVTGIDDGTDGRILILVNDGGFNITLKHQDAGSAAENRFKFGAGVDIILGPDDALILIYDSTGLRWRDIAGGAGGSVAGAGVANQVAVWSGPATITGSANVTVVGGILTLGSNLQFSQKEALQMRIENRVADPVTPAVGEIWLRTDL